MQLHQIKIEFNAEHDRLLMSVSTSDGQEILLWLTRRCVKLLWPLLIKMVESQPRVQLQGATPEARAPLSWPLHTCSALEGAGTEALVKALAADLPLGPQLYPADTVSDQPEQLLMAELIREQVLQHTREEVPHSVAVSIDREIGRAHV